MSAATGLARVYLIQHRGIHFFCRGCSHPSHAVLESSRGILALSPAHLPPRVAVHEREWFPRRLEESEWASLILSSLSSVEDNYNKCFPFVSSSSSEEKSLLTFSMIESFAPVRYVTSTPAS